MAMSNYGPYHNQISGMAQAGNTIGAIYPGSIITTGPPWDPLSQQVRAIPPSPQPVYTGVQVGSFNITQVENGYLIYMGELTAYGAQHKCYYVEKLSEIGPKIVALLVEKELKAGQ
jgi:hypothetical protein